MGQYYDQLMQVQGADELLEIVKRFEVLSDNLQRRTFDLPLVLPDLFVFTHPGVAGYSLFSLLAEYLNEKTNLMSFYGNTKFVDFKLEYNHPDGEFRDMFRFLQTMHMAAGFRDTYKGVVRIDLTDWLGHHKDAYFRDFLQMLSAHTHDWLIVLSVADETKGEDAVAMESIASMYLRLESVTLHLPTDKELTAFACEQLAKYGFTLDRDATALLSESIAVLRNNRHFRGIRTVTDLCSDIVYTVYSCSNKVSRLITAPMLADFSADSPYIRRTIEKIERTVTLGF